MKDPFYAQILYAVESRLHESDLQAKQSGLTLTDSAARSVLVRALNAERGRPPAPVPTAAGLKEKFLTSMLEGIDAVRRDIRVQAKRQDGSVEEGPLPGVDWVLVLECLRDSCELRTGSRPGSREYLDYLARFIGKASPI